MKPFPPQSQFETPESAAQPEPPEIRRVAGEEPAKPGEIKGERKTKIEVPDELKHWQERAQRLVDGHRRFFASFARDVSLKFKISNGFFIDLEKGEVNLDAKWFAEKGFSERQTLWAVLHELSHFRDMAEDPEKMMANFDHVRSQAKETGAEMMAKWDAAYGDSDPELVARLKRKRGGGKRPERALNPVEEAAYKIHHTFYNVFDDIYVNASVARRASAFEAGAAGGQEVERLYREKLFPKTDYRGAPRHLQFLYALLRDEMIPGEKLELGDDAKAALESAIAFQGKTYAPREIVAKFLKPGPRRDAKAGARYLVLRKTIEPVFMELLKKDLADWQPEKPPELPAGAPDEQEAGDPNPFKQEYDDFAKNSPDQLDNEEMFGWFDKHVKDKKEAAAREAQEKKAERKSAEEKAAESARASDAAWCEKTGVAAKDLERFRQAEAEIAPYLDELSALWGNIIFSSSREAERGKEGYFKTGTELDVQKVIEEWPKLEGGRHEDVRVMKREAAKETLVKKPELIRVRFVADQSGSMDAGKRRILERTVALLLSSLREFNTRLNLTRNQTGSKLEVDSEVWGFGSTAEKIKPLGAGGDPDAEYADIVRAFGRLAENRGSTADYLALAGIGAEVTPEERERIGDGKTLDIVFEITDGGSDDAWRARGEADALLEAGLIVRAFQIGQVSDEERRQFDAVWNDGREAPLGQAVGEKIENLLPAVAAALKEHLRGVRL